MKRIFAILACTLMLICAFHISAFAEGESVEGVEPNEVVVDTSTPTDENATESEIATNTTTHNITTDKITAYIEEHPEEVGVLVSLALSAIFTAIDRKRVNKSISATNHNAITVAENSERAITDATARMEAFTALLAEYRASEEEKKELKKTLNEAMAYIKTSKLANIEFANELAELLVLANIPNSKKEELYSRHVAAVNAIAEAGNSEVTADENGNEA